MCDIIEKTGIIKLKFGENIVALGFEIYSFSIWILVRELIF